MLNWYQILAPNFFLILDIIFLATNLLLKRANYTVFNVMWYKEYIQSDLQRLLLLFFNMFY